MHREAFDMDLHLVIQHFILRIDQPVPWADAETERRGSNGPISAEDREVGGMVRAMRRKSYGAVVAHISRHSSTGMPYLPAIASRACFGVTCGLVPVT